LLLVPLVNSLISCVLLGCSFPLPLFSLITTKIILFCHKFECSFTIFLISYMVDLLTPYRSRDSAFGIATSYGLDDRGVGVRFPLGSRIFSSPRLSDGLWAHPASYQMGGGGSFPGGKETEAWSWPLTFS
jgi:hypothetical protein